MNYQSTTTDFISPAEAVLHAANDSFVEIANNFGERPAKSAALGEIALADLPIAYIPADVIRTIEEVADSADDKIRMQALGIRDDRRKQKGASIVSFGFRRHADPINRWL